MSNDCARKDHHDCTCKCLPTCIWCGHWLIDSERRARCNAFGGAQKYECADRTACDARIKRAIMLGPGSTR